MRSPNRYLEAFRENANVIGLSSALALSAATLNPLPLIVGLVAEAAYLIFVPDSRWYAVRLEKRFDAAVRERRAALKAQVWAALRPDLRERFERLECLREEIGAQELDDQTWFREVVRKLDFLLEKYLQFASKDAQGRAYLRSVLGEIRAEGAADPRRGSPPPGNNARRLTLEDRKPAGGRGGEGEREQGPSAATGPLPRDPDDRWVQRTAAQIQDLYEAEMAEVREALEGQADVHTQAVLEKRLEVIQRRHQFVAKTGRILTNLGQQLKLLEDAFGLINDELRARSPDQVLADIDDVVGQTNTMTTLLEEVAPLERMLERMSK